MAHCNQTLQDFQLVLVDNGFDDDTEAVCRETLSRFPDIEVCYIFEARPGKTHALGTGVRACSSMFVANCDVDTIYPPHFLRCCDELFEQLGYNIVAVMALNIYGDPDSL